MRAAQAGDRAALDALLRRHHDRIATVCRRIAGRDQDAQDATQEAMIAIARGIGRFDGRAAFTTWAHRVTVNACLDEVRRRGRRPVPVLPDEEHAPRGSGASSSPGIEAVPDRLAVDAALAQLPEEFRVAVVLRDLCDLDYADIALQLGIPPGTVRSRIARGRAHLAELLRGQPAEATGNQPSTGRRPTSRPGDATQPLDTGTSP